MLPYLINLDFPSPHPKKKKGWGGGGDGRPMCKESKVRDVVVHNVFRVSNGVVRHKSGWIIVKVIDKTV